MIEHIVLVQLKDDVTDEQKRDFVTKMVALKDKVPGIIEASAGINFSQRAGPYGLAAVIRLQDREALAGYGPHPAHQEVVRLLDEISEHRLIVDYEH